MECARPGTTDRKVLSARTLYSVASQLLAFDRMAHSSLS